MNADKFFASLVLPLEAATALVLAMMPLPAKAYTPTVCHFGIGVVSCQPITANPSARVIQVEPESEEVDGVTETRDAWRERCKPTLSARNATGMRSWTYAQKGCEYGPE